MPLRMNMQSGRKHKSKLDIWENQWSGSLAAGSVKNYAQKSLQALAE